MNKNNLNKLNEAVYYPSQGIYGWCLQSADKLHRIPANPTLKDRIQPAQEGDGQDEGLTPPDNQQDIPQAPAPNHDWQMGNQKNNNASNQPNTSNSPNSDSQQNQNQNQNQQNGQNGQNGSQGNQNQNQQNGQGGGQSQGGQDKNGQNQNQQNDQNQQNGSQQGENKKPQPGTRETKIVKDRKGNELKVTEIHLTPQDFKKTQERSSIDKFGQNGDLFNKEKSDQLFKENPYGAENKKDKGGDTLHNSYNDKKNAAQSLMNDLKQNGGKGRGSGTSLFGLLDPIMQELFPPAVKIDWKEQLKKFMTNPQFFGEYEVENPDWKIGVTDISGANILARTEGDEYPEDLFVPQKIASIFYLIDNSGSMFGVKLANGDDVFQETFKQIIELEKECAVETSMLTYFADGLKLVNSNSKNPSIDDRFIRLWHEDTDPFKVLKMIGRKDDDIGGGTNVIKALRRIYEEENSGNNDSKIAQYFKYGLTKIIIVTDGCDDYNINWSKEGVQDEDIIWLLVNTKDTIKKLMADENYCASLEYFAKAGNVIFVPTEEL